MIEESDSKKSHLKLLQEEYVKLQRTHADLQRKYDDLLADTTAGKGDPAFSSFQSRLFRQCDSLYGRKTFSDLLIRLKGDSTVPAHKIVFCARYVLPAQKHSFEFSRSYRRSEEWREENLVNVNELDWTDLEVDVGSALLRW